jgi:hypothetical protein
MWGFNCCIGLLFSYKTRLMNFLIFKTSVETISHVRYLKMELDQLAGNGFWNFDLQDCDHILRVPSGVKAESTINLLRKFGFNCIELED